MYYNLIRSGKPGGEISAEQVYFLRPRVHQPPLLSRKTHAAETFYLIQNIPNSPKTLTSRIQFAYERKFSSGVFECHRRA